MTISIETLVNEIRTIYQSNPVRAEKLMEAYLDEILKDHPPAGRITLLEKLVHQFEVAPLEVVPPLESASSRAQEDINFESKEFSRLFSLLFGERVSALDLSSTELMEKLAHSLNTIFDTMNEIIRVIDTTLLGKKQELETIRHIIGSQLEGETQTDSLQDYLTRIQKAFLVSHKAFQMAAYTKITEVLNELRPERFESERIGVLKFGPLRKAEFFEMYKEKFQSFKHWFDSGRFKEELLREFEKTCQKLYNADRR